MYEIGTDLQGKLGNTFRPYRSRMDNGTELPDQLPTHRAFNVACKLDVVPSSKSCFSNGHGSDYVPQAL